MWRSLFFILVFSTWASAQNNKITAVQWSITPSYSKATIEATAHITLSQKAKNKIDFLLYAASVTEVRVWQGRLKQKLNYSFSSNTLTVDATGYKSIFVTYTLNLNDAAHLGESSIDQIGLGLNTKAASGITSDTRAELWFPHTGSFNYPVKINVLLPSQWTYRTSYPTSYTVENGAQTAVFLESPVPHEAFYLLAGDFAKMQVPDLLEVVELSYAEEVEARAKDLKKQQAEFLAYAQQQNISDQEIYNADSIAQTITTKIYPLTLDFYNDEANMLYQTMLLQKHDTLVASLLLYRFLNRKTEPSIIAGELATDSFSKPQLFVWLNYYLRKHNLSLADSSKVNLNEAQRIAIHLAKAVWENQKLPELDLNYKYSDNLMYVFAKKPAVQIPLALSYVLNGKRHDTIFNTSNATTDTLKIASQGAPYLIYAHKEQLTPAAVHNHMPDNYWLYLLGKGSDIEKREALSALLNTSNANLKATVIGIALDDADPRIRVKALEKAGDLTIVGQNRLKTTLINLQTQDPNPQVQDLAKEWVEKYYGL